VPEVAGLDVSGASEASLTWPAGTEAPPHVAPAAPVSRDHAGDAPVDVSAADHVLVTACLRGRVEAFDVLVERYRRFVYQLCYRHAGNHQDAADLTQEAFVRAWRGLRRFRGDSSLSTWLYRIAVNVSLSHASGRDLDVEPIDRADQVSSLLPAPDAELLREQRARRVKAAVARLPPKQRTTVILRIYHDLTHEEIAGILGRSIGTVKANLFFALRNLRARLEEGGF
jgi:RNA polymerase sigma-70 factor (ECF subfamily)